MGDITNNSAANNSDTALQAATGTTTTSSDLVHTLAPSPAEEIRAWRKSMVNCEYNGVYKDLFEQLVLYKKNCKETADFLELPNGLRLFKTPLTMNVNHPHSKDNVTEVSWPDYTWERKKMTAVKQKVFDDKNNSFHSDMKDRLSVVWTSGYRSMTKQDFDEIEADLPGADAEQKNLALQWLTGWYGRIMLDPQGTTGEKTARNFLLLDRDDIVRDIEVSSNPELDGLVVFVSTTKMESTEYDDVKEGKVISFDTRQGFGFIEVDGGRTIKITYGALWFPYDSGDDVSPLTSGERVRFKVSKEGDRITDLEKMKDFID